MKEKKEMRYIIKEDLRKTGANLRTVSVVLGSLHLLPRQVMQ